MAAALDSSTLAAPQVHRLHDANFAVNTEPAEVSSASLHIDLQSSRNIAAEWKAFLEEKRAYLTQASAGLLAESGRPVIHPEATCNVVCAMLSACFPGRGRGS